MEAKAESGGVKHPAHYHFRLCILTPNAGHHPAPGCLVYNIDHQASRRLPTAFMKMGYSAS